MPVFPSARDCFHGQPRKATSTMASKAARGVPSRASVDIPCVVSIEARRRHLPTPHTPPSAVRRALRELGADIRDARRRRGLPMAVVAEREFTSRSTLQRVEAGHANVSIGIFAGVLLSIGTH